MFNYSLITIAAAILLALPVRAESWAAPTIRIIGSPDGSALLRITPAESGKPEARATAAVFKLDARTGNYLRTATFSLRNPIAPHEALITNGARHIVTFDDWAAIGRTENVVVVYRGTGELVRAWSLTDIFPESERKAFFSTMSSTRWRGDVALEETPGRPPLAIIRPETLMTLADKSRKVGPLLLLDLARLKFEKQ
jgi:hypothetical protein